MIGGRFSDYIVAKMKDENGGVWYPEVCTPDFVRGFR